MYPVKTKTFRSNYFYTTPPSSTPTSKFSYPGVSNADTVQRNNCRILISSHGSLLQPGANYDRNIRRSSHTFNNFNNNNNNNNNNSWKVIRFTTVIICSVVCVYQIVDRIKHFLSEPVNANVELMRNTSIQFPAFTICPPWPYRFSKLYNLYMYNNFDLQKDSLWKVASLVNISDFYDLASYEYADVNGKKNRKAEFMIYLSMSNLPSAGGVVIPTVKNVSTYIGKCSTAFFDQPTLYQGISTMLIMMFSMNMKITKTVIERTFLDVDKIAMIHLHENNDDPVHIAPVSSVKLLREYSTTISLDVKEYRFLNRSKILCISQEDHNRCRGDCVAKQVLPTAKCRIPMEFPQLNHLPLCKDFKSFFEFFGIIGKAYVNVSEMNKCTTKCPRKCYQTMYIMNVQYLAKEATGNTRVEFYFSDNVFEIVVETLSYGIINLLCDMGGNLGLFLGFSLLTLLDIIRSISNALGWVKKPNV